jgi:hypothetical protein
MPSVRPRTGLQGLQRQLPIDPETAPLTRTILRMTCTALTSKWSKGSSEGSFVLPTPCIVQPADASASSYSSRKVSHGSVRVARIAGAAPASSAIAARKIQLNANVVKSCGFTPYSKLDMTPLNAIASARPAGRLFSDDVHSDTTNPSCCTMVRGESP